MSLAAAVANWTVHLRHHVDSSLDGTAYPCHDLGSNLGRTGTLRRYHDSSLDGTGYLHRYHDSNLGCTADNLENSLDVPAYGVEYLHLGLNDDYLCLGSSDDWLCLGSSDDDQPGKNLYEVDIVLSFLAAASTAAAA